MKGPAPTKENSASKVVKQQEEVSVDQSTKAAQPNTVKPQINKDGQLKCKNYGCNKFYKEEENTEDCCRHHVKPPFFHDTKKGWSCCSHRSVYDWSEFESIEGCTVGKHSQVDPKLTFAPSPTVQAAISAESSKTY